MITQNDKVMIEMLKRAQSVTITVDCEPYGFEITCGGRVPHAVALAIQDHLNNGCPPAEREKGYNAIIQIA